MKQYRLLLLLSVGSMLWATSLFAQHDNLVNVSAEFMRTGGRTAALDAADIAVYNPAGLVHLEDGFHINLANQSIFRSPNHTFAFPIGTPEVTYQQASPDLLLPNLYLAYKKNKLALFGGVYVSGGGGSLDYPEGSINTDLIILQIQNKVLIPPNVTYGMFYGGGEGKILASSFYITPMLGVSYGITDKLSAALGVRYLMATNTQEAEVKFTQQIMPPPVQLPTEFRLESTDKASGFGFTGSLNYRFSENFNLAVRYETKATLEFETDSIQDDFGIIEDGALARRDLPASLSAGANFNLTDNLSALLDFGWYFQKQADWDVNPKDQEWSELAGDVGRFALGLGYDIGGLLALNGWWGYTLYQYEDRPAYYNKLGVFETVKSSNWTLGLGGKLSLGDRLDINLAVSQTFWKKDDVVEMVFPAALPDPTYDVKINNSITAVALGLNLRLGGE